jgi:urate oxidase
MALIGSTDGKGGLRVRRSKKSGLVREAHELEVTAMLIGGFDSVFAQHEDVAVVPTDTIENIIGVVAHENLGLDAEDFCQAVAARFLECYPQVETVTVQGLETECTRMSINGGPHPRGFVLECGGQSFTGAFATRGTAKVVSGISGLTFTTSTESDRYHKDDYATLAGTRDRMCAIAMEASWLWGATPADYSAANAKILGAMLETFATACSESVRDRLYRMGTAALTAVPEISEASLACPDPHHSPVDLRSFGLTNEDAVLLPADESHGQIECTVARD